MKPMIVYEIKNKINGRRYVGSSINGKSRLREHFRLLKNKQHHNHWLQMDYDKYGEHAFEVRTIYQVYDKKVLRELERDYIISNDILQEYNIGKF